MRRCRYREEVTDDLAEAAGWYEERRVGLGARFLDAVEETLLRVEEHPEQFPLVYEDFRRALVRRPFPYQIFFRVEARYVDI